MSRPRTKADVVADATKRRDATRCRLLEIEHALHTTTDASRQVRLTIQRNQAQHDLNSFQRAIDAHQPETTS